MTRTHILANYLLEDNLYEAQKYLSEAFDISSLDNIITKLTLKFKYPNVKNTQEFLNGLKNDKKEKEKFDKQKNDLLSFIMIFNPLLKDVALKFITSVWINKRYEDLVTITANIKELKGIAEDEHVRAKEIYSRILEGSISFSQAMKFYDEIMDIVNKANEQTPLKELLKKYKMVSENQHSECYIIKSFEANAKNKHELFCNTSWCVRNVGMFEEYAPPYYLFVTKGEEPEIIALLHIPSSQFKDIKDKTLDNDNVPKIASILEELVVSKNDCFLAFGDIEDCMYNYSSSFKKLIPYSKFIDMFKDRESSDFKIKAFGLDTTVAWYENFREDGIIETIEFSNPESKLSSAHFIKCIDKNEFEFAFFYGTAKEKDYTIKFQDVNDLAKKIYEMCDTIKKDLS